MAGHSKWAQIKRKKAATDSKRGKVFSKLVKEISVSARIGGSDPDSNPRLRTAIEKAKGVNMPQENIRRAIQKGTGEISGTIYEEVTYEGYGPGGVAILIDTLTDNKNRTVADIRHIMTKNGGNLGEAGCVSWMFEKKGYILISKNSSDEDQIMSIILEEGADDLRNDPKDNNYEIITPPDTMMDIKNKLEEEGITVLSAEISMIPKNYLPLDNRTSEQVLKLIEAIEDSDDVQNVYSNFDVPEEILMSVV